MRIRRLLAATLAGLGVLGTAWLRAAPVQPTVRASVGIWYRGTPAGVPTQDDLALIRALGFGTVVWPFDDPRGRRDLDRMAELVSLRVVDPDGGRSAARSFVLRVATIDPARLPALAWSAVADGARLLLFDGGAPAGSGLEDEAGRPAAWVGPAQRLARQVEANAELIGRLAPGLPVDVEAVGSRIALFESGPAWVWVAINPTAAAEAVVARVPRLVPYGPWVSLVDGTDMAMIVRTDHHEYRTTLDAGEARVYVIDKSPPPTSW